MPQLSTLAQIPKILDPNFIARGVKQLGPCNIYTAEYGKGSVPVPMTGTVTAAASATLTGTGTLFTTEIKVGQYIEINGVGVFEVKTITSDTSLDLYVTVTASGDTIARVTLRFLGCTDATKLNFGLTKTDLMCSQEGAVRGDRVVTGYTASVEFGLADGTPDDVASVTQGMFNQRTPAGLLKSTYFGFPLGEQDSSILQTLFLIRIFGGVESTDANDIFTLLRAAPNVESELTYDAETQIFYKAAYEGYIDRNTQINGLPLIFYMGDIS